MQERKLILLAVLMISLSLISFVSSGIIDQTKCKNIAKMLEGDTQELITYLEQNSDCEELEKMYYFENDSPEYESSEEDSIINDE